MPSLRWTFSSSKIVTASPSALPQRDGKNRYGLKLLNPTDSSSTSARPKNDYPVDIVAVHGFRGDAYKTWQHENGELWLQGYLPKEFPGCRVFTFGYPAHSFSRGTGTFETFAEALLEDLKGVRSRKDEQRRPIIFVSHGMGGIVVKKALVLAYLHPEFYTTTTLKTSAILFFATPHRGSSAAKWVALLAGLANASVLRTGLTPKMSSDTLKSLKREAPELQTLARDFRSQTGNIQFASFIEQKQTPPFGKRIVDDFSGSMDVATERRIPMMDCDHRTICRFPNETHHSYIKVLNVIRDFANEAMVRFAAHQDTSCSF